MRNVLLKQLHMPDDGWTKQELSDHAQHLLLGQPRGLVAVIGIVARTEQGEIELFSTLAENEDEPLDRKTLAKALRALATMYDP